MGLYFPEGEEGGHYLAAREWEQEHSYLEAGRLFQLSPLDEEGEIHYRGPWGDEKGP